MTKGKFSSFLFFTIFFCLLFCIPVTAQQDTETAPAETSSSSSQGSTFFNNLLNTVGQVLNEKLKDEFDKWLGKYEGKIEQVRLLEQTPDSIVLEITYRGVKKQDGVSAKGEVLRGGMVLPGFTSTLGQVQGKEGIARLTISWDAASGWDVSSPESETSDQIRLYLVRNDYPDRHFGELIYDFPKRWGEEPYGTDTEDGEAVELGEEVGGEEDQSTGTEPQRDYSPGSILIPTILNKKGGVHDLSTKGGDKLLQLRPLPTESYDFYKNAHLAKWRSNRGTLNFPGKNNDNRGFALRLSKGKISLLGTKVENLLETHPAWMHNGWIEGRYPAIIPKPGVHFVSTVALLHGAYRSNGVIFKVYVKPESQAPKKVYSARVTHARHRNVDIDLSPWANKSIELILYVDAAGSSSQDWAVWVAPKLEKR